MYRETVGHVVVTEWRSDRRYRRMADPMAPPCSALRESMVERGPGVRAEDSHLVVASSPAWIHEACDAIPSLTEPSLPPMRVPIVSALWRAAPSSEGKEIYWVNI